MRLGIISDTHDNIWNLKKVLDKLKSEKIEAILHCGDFCAPFVLLQLAETGIPVHLVWGNTNDKSSERKIASETANITLHEDTGELEIGGKKVAFTHYPDDARKLAGSGRFDLVFFGHNHVHSDEMIGRTRLINPGNVMGNRLPATFVVYDTKTDDMTVFDISEI